MNYESVYRTAPATPGLLTTRQGSPAVLNPPLGRTHILAHTPTLTLQLSIMKYLNYFGFLISNKEVK